MIHVHRTLMQELGSNLDIPLGVRRSLQAPAQHSHVWGQSVRQAQTGNAQIQSAG